MSQVENISNRVVNTIRALTIDATQEAGEGHPGMPMGAAPMGYALYCHAMRHNPANPHWANRDRYIQSAGHGSMLQYALLHLTGYDVPMSELRNYRQLGSKTPGHPEVNDTPGVEVTTGPLGQGIAMAVGFASAERHLAATFNQPNFDIVDHYTYVIAGDGDLMEGISAEAASLAGHLGLHKLVVLYDDNGITIDGKTDLTFTEDVQKRYRSYGWHVLEVADGNDISAIKAALEQARAEHNRPTFIAVKSTIGYGSPKLAGTSKVHGSVLGAEEAAATKAALGVDWPAFTVPEDVLTHTRRVVEFGADVERLWNELFAKYEVAHPELAAEFTRRLAGELPADFAADLHAYGAPSSIATRGASRDALNLLAPRLTELVGGSADLAGSNLTMIAGETAMDRGDYAGRIIHFGIREHAMAAVANGLALHGGVLPFVATFLVFSDYLKPALRLSAIMKQPVIYVLTHDTIGVGGDGPTHQPIEHLVALRAIPNVRVFRPADANETAQAWELAVTHKTGPTVLALSRQNLRTMNVPAGAVAKGAYVVQETNANPELLLIATGSEVELAVDAAALLEQDGKSVRVVSMPSVDVFLAQSAEYQQSVLPTAIKARVVIEAGATWGWERFAGDNGAIIGMHSFGLSAPGDVVMREFGFTKERVREEALKVLENL